MVRIKQNLQEFSPSHWNRQKVRKWKSTVLPHFLQNLRYIQSTTDVAKLQTSLNLSLARALHAYGDHTALLVDTGVPPLKPYTIHPPCPITLSSHKNTA